MKFLEAIRNSRWWRVVRATALVVVLVVCGGSSAWVATRLPKKTARPPAAGARDDAKSARFTRPDRDTLVASTETVSRVGIKTEPAAKPSRPRTLPPLQGCLALDNEQLHRVHARFGGEVVSVATIEDPTTAPSHRSVRVGDSVKPGQLLAVIWSKDLGEKKSELVDAISKLRTDEQTLKRLEALQKDLGTSDRSLREQERTVESDRIAVERAVRTLRSWRLTEAEVDAVRAEADRLRSGKADASRGEDWAKVEVRCSRGGMILEKNFTVGDIVDTNLDLFKIGDLSQLAVWAHVYEEDLPLLQRLGKPAAWTVMVPSRGERFPGELEQVGPVIDPNQHTALVKGRVANPTGELKVGQFVTVTLELPAERSEVVVPADAVVEDGRESVVFVQPNANEPRFVRRPVQVSKRFRDAIHLKPGAVTAGDLVVTAGALLLNDALQLQEVAR